VSRATEASPWIAVGARAADGLRRALPAGEGLEAASDVHAALLSLAMDGRRPVLVEADALLPRPRAALRALRAAAGPDPVVVLLEAGFPADPRAMRAAEALGTPRVAVASDALAVSSPPSPVKAAPSAGSVEVTGSSNRTSAPELASRSRAIISVMWAEKLERSLVRSCASPMSA